MNRGHLRTIFFVVGDFTLLIFGFLFVFAIRRRTPFIPPLQDLSFYFPFFVVYIGSFLTSFYIFRLYKIERPQFSLSYLSDYIRALLLWIFLIVSFSFFSYANYSRVLLLYSLIPGIIIPFIFRILVVRLLPYSVPQAEDKEISQMARELIDLEQASLIGVNSIEGIKEERVKTYAYLFAKRFLDIAMSLLGLLLTTPFYPIIILFIRWRSPGPAILKQERIGQAGYPFVIYKFRTMEAKTPLYEIGPTSEYDSRITSAGRFLRRYSLDELPQFWNILKGEMSIVGPRPEMPFLAAQHNEWQKKRLTVKPGITGLWQIFGRKDIPLSENLEYDFYYINHRSFLFDLVIILKTIPAILLGRGAY
ncbi:MAG: sugar transferase [Patescibacteria group bacterium]